MNLQGVPASMTVERHFKDRLYLRQPNKEKNVNKKVARLTARTKKLLSENWEDDIKTQVRTFNSPMNM